MVLARVAEFLSSGTSSATTSSHLLESGETTTTTTTTNHNSISSPLSYNSHHRHGQSNHTLSSPDFANASAMEEVAATEIEQVRAPYPNVILAGGLGGLTGDMLMHSLDTVKTRQQGDPHRPPKYHSLGNTYHTIWKQEGIARGLYGGITPAAIGSFGGTCIFFGTYEWSKRALVDMGVAPSIAYLSAGFVADLAASPLYVPSEVLKTRLQLQGRYNNPYFQSGYNYRSTLHATRVIARQEGLWAFFYGYKATLYRDLPFSALQFAFYEKEREFAKWCVGSKDLSIPLEILTGATAGGMAGTITCPLDVVKTRIQTQLHPSQTSSAISSTTTSTTTAVASTSSSQTHPRPHPATAGVSSPVSSAKRHISTSSPSTTFTKPGAPVTLDTSSVMTGLRIIYKTEGMVGLFRGVGPRALWTSVQSATMLVLYQSLLRYFEQNNLLGSSPSE